MPAAGDPILASDVIRARPVVYNDVASSALAAGSSNTAIPGISITFDTETDGAEITLVWFCQYDLSGSTTSTGSARPLVTGPSYSYEPPLYATFGAEIASDAATSGNSHKTTLGDAGSYTVIVRGTTPANMLINIYSSLTIIVQEQFA